MPVNLITDPSFEDGIGWTYGTGWSRSKQPGHSGDYLARGEQTAPATAAFLEGATISLDTSKEYAYSIWVRSDSPGSTALVWFLSNALGSGDQTLVTITAAEAQGQWTQYSGTFTPTLTSVVPTYRITSPSAATWLVDDASIALAKTIAIRDAIVTDLETITTGNGYSVTVAAVYTEPEELERKASPSIQLEPSEGGQSDTESLTNRIGDVVQLFSFELYIKATDPITSAANLLDDIRNAIEVSTSTVNGIAGVDSVTVSSWSDVRTTDDIHNLAGIVDGEITVRYQYTRGSV